MRLYTTTGDQGETDLLGARVSKADPRIDVIGALDEATSALGLGRALADDPATNEIIMTVQRDLYRIMAELAFTPDLRPAGFVLGADRVEWLSATTDEISARVTLPREFILPGESVAGAALDVARTVIRRAERALVALTASEAHNPELVRYLNRLSSLAFVLARLEDATATAGAAPPLARQTPRRRPTAG